MANMNIAEKIAHGDDLQLPMVLHLANFDTLHCTQMLRFLPGKRAVMKAQWQGQTVLVKLMLNTASGARNARREMAGYEILTAAKITTPKLLLKTRGDDKSHVLIFEFLHAQTLYELWQDQPQRRAQIAEWCVCLFAKLHRNRYQHVDFHLNNFLAVGDVFYVVDVSSIRKVSLCSLSSKTFLHVPKKYGLWQRYNLAKGFPFKPPMMFEVMINALQKNYPAAAADDKFAHAIGHASRRSRSRYLKKCFRKCSEFNAHKSWREVAIWNRAHECEDLLSFIRNPEAWMAKGKLLKDGNSATVVLVTMNDMRGAHKKSVVIKRNNIKSVFHGLCFCLRATRSHTNWRNAHLLKINDIKTPTPIAFVEKRWGPFRMRGYYMSAFNDFPSAAQKYKSQVPNENELTWFAELFTSMRLARLYHGDLKASNLLVTDHGVAVIDLDSLKQCSEKNIHVFMHKDRQRFLKNWRNKSQHLKLFSTIFDTA